MLHAVPLKAQQIVHTDKVLFSEAEAQEVLAAKEGIAVAHADAVARANILRSQPLGQCHLGGRDVVSRNVGLHILFSPF